MHISNISLSESAIVNCMFSCKVKIIFAILIIPLFCFAQRDTFDFKRDFRYHIFETEETITIDGKLSEETWTDAEKGTNFWQKLPYYAPNADPKTEIMLSYNDEFLFVGARCYQDKELVIQSLKRDEYWDNDGIAIILDPLNSRANAVLFGSSAIGVQWDATRTETSDVDANWSNKWFVETHVTDSLWTAEFAIPFKILRYSQNQNTWGMNFVRNLKFCNEYHNWTAVPESFWPPNPAFAGSLVWDKIPQAKSSNYNIIPYISAGVSKTRDAPSATTNLDLGVDARIALNSSLNLDLTLFPDFSQIEADELVTNLTRFDIRLPEKRTFFLENADLFADFGGNGARPFFSRKIGLDENFQAVPISYGARLTGNLTDDIRIGALNIHSQTTENSPGQNQTAISLRKQLGRSFIQGMFLNQQAFDGSKSIAQKYSRNASLEGLYLSDNGQIGSWFGLHQSFKPGFSDQTGMYNFGFRFTNPSWEVITDFLRFEDNFFIDMGFANRIENYDAVRDTTIRLGYNFSNTTAEHRIRPQKGNIAIHRFGLENLSIFNPDWSLNEQNSTVRYGLALKSNHEFRIRLSRRILNLQYPFSFTGETPLPADEYKNYDTNFQYISDDRKAFYYDVSLQTGSFYNGNLTQFRINSNYRIQPWANFSLSYQWNKLSFPDPYGSSLITALLSKIEIGFNRYLLWSTQIQYVDQSNFIGINSRLQWRFSPMSDIFLVWIDNYDIESMLTGNTRILSNNRALVFKINYWY